MKYPYFFFLLLVFYGCGGPADGTQTKTEPVPATPSVETVATFTGLQVTGVAVSPKGRIFANFPRWRSGVPFSVVEVDPKTGTHKPFPNAVMNNWQMGQPITDSVFVSVQSVVAYKNTLFVLDTRNPQFKGLVGTPQVFVFDLAADSLAAIYPLEEPAVNKNSYVNDMRFDETTGNVYLTDSGVPGIIILDPVEGDHRRILHNHYSTKAETDHLTIDGKKWNNTVHVDGIAFDAKTNKLYYHALTGYNLYALPLSDDMMNAPDSLIEKRVELVRKTSAPDGMIFDSRGNLYYADLENHKINYLTPSGEVKTLVEGEKVKWADSFSIHGEYLYYTNSRIHEATGDISDMVFSINRVRIGEKKLGLLKEVGK